jgi:hypothetical protein
LKGVERKADWKQDRHQRRIVSNSKQMGSAADRPGKKIEIFKEDEQPDVTKKAQIEIETTKTLLLCFLDLQAGNEIKQRDAPDHPNVPGAPAHVKVVAGGKNNDSSRRAPRHQDQHPHENKEEQKLKAIE